MAGADPNTRDRCGSVPLLSSVTVEQVDLDMVRMLVKYGADQNIRINEICGSIIGWTGMSVSEVVGQVSGRERREIFKILDKKAGQDEGALGDHLCETPGCGKATPSALQCPGCKELNIGGYFCSQDCFNGNWSSHTIICKET